MKTKTFLQTLILLFFVFSISAQQGINYKAIINDANGDALVKTTVTIQFTILLDGTTEVYKETHTPTTDANGIIIVNIGEGTVVNGVFKDIDWGSNPHYLKTEIDKGEGLIDLGTTEFKTVPYALHAKTAEITHSIDGSETIVMGGTNVNVAGNGTIENPYEINAIMCMSQSERDGIVPVEGFFVYNTDTHQPNYYNGTIWMNYDGTVATSSLEIGQRYQGGKIAYIFQLGDPQYLEGEIHGLIVSEVDFIEAPWWNGNYTVTGATSTVFGNINTTKIIDNQGNIGWYAANICRNWDGGGFSDWYLPSINELNKLYLNRYEIGCNNVRYWSSTEINLNYAKSQDFNSGIQYNSDKNYSFRMRAIRIF